MTSDRPQGGLDRRACALGLLSVLPLLGAAQTADPASQANALEAGQWLARIQNAAANRSYQGTLAVFSAASGAATSRVLHLVDGRQRLERIEVLDGKPRTQYRVNDQLTTLWPDSKLAVVEQRDPIIEFPGLPTTAGQRTLDSYELRIVGTDRIAGHEADVLMLKPRDGLRFAQRWWAERESGLLLRSDLLGGKGELLETSTFTELSLATKAVADLVTAPLKKLDGWKVVRPRATRAQLDAEGWTVAKPVPGFQLVSGTRRPLDNQVDAPPSADAVQLVFSDGLTHVSVFIEAYDARRHKQAIRTSLGTTQTVMSRHGDWWFTIVGEVPMATVEKFDTALERKP